MAPSANKPAAPATDAPEGMPHADEGLKTLIERFRAAPASTAFVDLATALLARGHAAEALRVAEHGLQAHPRSAEGRVGRAAALLALGRPRVAYVELRRALALEPGHSRGLRLLGRAYKAAGVPSRAAELLAQRLASADPTPGSDAAPSSVAFPPAAATTPDAPLPAETSVLPPNLFSNLTVDLGLGSAIPEDVPPRKVEITQVIRRKGMPRPPRSASELAAIEGPIVDTTQPGQIVESEGAPDDGSLDPPALAPLFDLGDEPLFQDATPFEVRPVPTQDIPAAPSRGADSDTVVESIEPSGGEAPAPVDLVGDLADLAPRAQDGPLVAPPPAPPRAPPEPREPAPRLPLPRPFEGAPTPKPAPEAPPGLERTLPAAPSFRGPIPGEVDLAGTAAAAPPSAPLEGRPTARGPAGPAPGPSPSDEPRAPEAEAPRAGPTAVTAARAAAAPEDGPEEARPTVPLAAAPSSGGLGVAAVERARVVEGRIVLVAPPRNPRRILLAVLGATAMLFYAAALVLFSLDELRPWLTEGQPEAEVRGSAGGPEAAARASDPEP